MITNKTIDSIIFDMDGTLWDAVGTYAKSWNIYFTKHNISKVIDKKELYPLMGLEERKYLEKVIPEFSEEERKNIYQDVIKIQYQLIEEEGGVLFEGVLNGLKNLSTKYKLFIVSNCPELTIKYFIKWAKIDSYISDTLAHGETLRPKADNILAITKKHQLQSPVYVGDTDSDRKQSKIANLPFVFMEYGFGKTSDYYKKFDSFDNFTKHMLGTL